MSVVSLKNKRKLKQHTIDFINHILNHPEEIDSIFIAYSTKSEGAFQADGCNTDNDKIVGMIENAKFVFQQNSLSLPRK